MSDQVEGEVAKKSKEYHKNISKLLGNIDPNCQIIFISTDVTGVTPTHVHMQGPSSDGVLIGGMLSEAGRIIFKTLDVDRKSFDQRIKDLEARIVELEKHEV